MFNAYKTQALIVDGVDLASAPITEVPNKYLAKNEQFYQISLDKVTFVKLK